MGGGLAPNEAAPVSVQAEAVRREARRGLALALPAPLWTVAFFLLPVAAIATWSCLRRERGVLLTTPTLENYQRFSERDSFRLALWNSLEVTLLVTVLSVALAYPLAYVIANWVASRRQRLWLMLAVLPFWTSYVVRSYA